MDGLEAAEHRRDRPAHLARGGKLVQHGDAAVKVDEVDHPLERLNASLVVEGHERLILVKDGTTVLHQVVDDVGLAPMGDVPYLPEAPVGIAPGDLGGV